MAAKARIQKRLYYKIGEACKALGIQPYVLRYWETEFPALSPSKSRSGQRVYSEKELEIIRRIKQLLYDEGYTIAGAKKKLEGELASGTLGEAASPGHGAAAISAHSSAPPSAAPVAPAAARPPNEPFAPIFPDASLAPGAPAVGSPATLTPLPTGRPTRTAVPYEALAVADPESGRAPALPLIHAAPDLAAAPAKAATGTSVRDEDGLPTLPLEPPAGAPPTNNAAAAFPTSARDLAPQPANLNPRPVPPSPAEPEPLSPRPAAPSPAEPKPFLPRPPAAAPTAAGHTLDTEAAKQIESLRKGIRKALQAAQEILALLDARSPQ